jgi:hypothetical protein
MKRGGSRFDSPLLMKRNPLSGQANPGKQKWNHVRCNDGATCCEMFGKKQSEQEHPDAQAVLVGGPKDEHSETNEARQQETQRQDKQGRGVTSILEQVPKRPSEPRQDND